MKKQKAILEEDQQLDLLAAVQETTSLLESRWKKHRNGAVERVQQADPSNDPGASWEEQMACALDELALVCCHWTSD